MSRLIALCRPETGAVGGQHFVAQNDISLLIQTELELGISNNNALGQCVLCTFFIQCNGIIAKLLRIFLSLAGETLLQIFHALLKGDILVMVTDLRLGGRGINRLRQLV